MADNPPPGSGELNLDRKIVTALERLSQVLRVMFWQQAKAHQLSPIQIQFLIYLYSHPSEESTVTELASRFQLTKPTVSDAVTTLVTKQLVRKSPSPEDRRMVWLQLTSRGEALANELASWSEPIRLALDEFSIEERENQFDFLLRLIDTLEKSGVMSRSRICLSCTFFRANSTGDPAQPHYCRFLKRPLSRSGLRVDCPDYVYAEEAME